MATSMASLLLRRSLRLSVPSPSPIVCGRTSLFFSSLASHPSSPLIRSTGVSKIAQNSHCLVRFSSVASKAKAKPKPKVSADENLSRVLDSEIDCAQQESFVEQAVDLPDGFPFEIVDTPGDQAITLKREFAGEKIQVNVFMDLDEIEDVKEDEEDDAEDADSSLVKMSLIVTIDKGEGPNLEFCCDLNANGLQIASMVMKKEDNPDEDNAYQGPEFSDLDENLQTAFCTYLEERGIKGSLFDFLHEYMMAKDDREYLTWLKNMKSFIEK